MSGERKMLPVNGFIAGKYPLIRAVMTKGELTGVSERHCMSNIRLTVSMSDFLENKNKK
jgi:hypothetical protein